MRIAPISNYYTNYNKVSSQYKPQSNFLNTDYSYAKSVFTGSEKKGETQPLYLKEKLELASFKVPGSEDALNKDFINAAAPYWTEHRDRVIAFLTHRGYKEYGYPVRDLGNFMRTYSNVPENMKKFLQMKKDGEYRFSAESAVVLAQNYDALSNEINKFLNLKNNNGTEWLLSVDGKSIVNCAKLYKKYPVYAEKLLNLRNYDGDVITINETLLETYSEYPEKFEEFLKVTKTNKNLQRFNDIYDFDVLVPAYAKYPDRLEEFAQMKRVIKDREEEEEYRFNAYEVANLANASNEYYNEIIQVINNNNLYNPEKCTSSEILAIAKALKEHPDAIPQLESIKRTREDENFSYIINHLDSYLSNPEDYYELATKKDPNGQFLGYWCIDKLLPEYANNPQLREMITRGKCSWKTIETFL